MCWVRGSLPPNRVERLLSNTAALVHVAAMGSAEDGYAARFCLPFSLPNSADSATIEAHRGWATELKNGIQANASDLVRSQAFSFVRSENPRVGGSTPSPGTMIFKGLIQQKTTAAASHSSLTGMTRQP